MTAEPVYLEDKLHEIDASKRHLFRSKKLPTWCPGCGYFSIAEGVAAALTDLGKHPKDTVIVSGIGCASRFPFFFSAYGLHSLHGRALPVATGIKTANPDLTVIAAGGDGDGFAIGGAHLPHAARRNVDITYLLFDNGIYGLTKGQTSPTSVLGFETASSPYGSTDQPLNPLLMVLSHGASWVGQAYAGQPQHLREMIAAAIQHRGFSYLHILSPCVTFDKTSRTYQNLGRTTRFLEAAHDASDLAAAMAEATRQEAPALGLFYRQDRPTLDDGLNTIIERAGGSPKRPRFAA